MTKIQISIISTMKELFKEPSLRIYLLEFFLLLNFFL